MNNSGKCSGQTMPLDLDFDRRNAKSGRFYSIILLIHQLIKTYQLPVPIRKLFFFFSPLDDLEEDKEIAHQAVLLVMSGTKRGAVHLCARVAELMRENRR